MRNCCRAGPPSAVATGQLGISLPPLMGRQGNGRRERIRTSGPYVPNVVLYQAELLSEPVRKGLPLTSGVELITMPPQPRNRPLRPCLNVILGCHLARAGRVCGGARLALYGVRLLGRRQVVRHWILIPAFEGSIPSAPASQSLLSGSLAHE